MSAINLTEGGVNRVFDHIGNLLSAAEGRLELGLEIGGGVSDQDEFISEALSVLLATKAYIKTFQKAGDAGEAVEFVAAKGVSFD